MSNIQTELNNIDSSNVSNGSKDLHYNTTHTDYMFQKHVINNHISFIIQPHFHISTKRSSRVTSSIVKYDSADLQNQLNNITANNPPPGNHENPDIGTM